jgi:hypothetical protein
MRFLYADSEPFPLSYAFLPILDKFVQNAARALSALHEIETKTANLAARKKAVQEGVDALDQYVAEISDVVMGEKAKSASPMVDGFAKELHAFVERSAQELRMALEQEVTELGARTELEIAALQAEVRDATAQMLLGGTPVAASRYRVRLSDHRYRWWATCKLGERLEVTYVLGTDPSTKWHEPRKVASLVGELEVQVGLKKGWLSRELVPVQQSLADLVIGAAVLELERAEIHLRKRVDASASSVVVQLTRSGTVVNADIERPIDAGESAPSHAAYEDIAKLEGFWAALIRAGEDLLPRRELVEDATLDGRDLLSGEHTLELVDFFVNAFAPTVVEIARRSPSPRELSLKLEHDDGRREEIYLQRDQLVGHLKTLDENMLKKLAPLEIMPS